MKNNLFPKGTTQDNAEISVLSYMGFDGEIRLLRKCDILLTMFLLTNAYYSQRNGRILVFSLFGNM
jgi:hypothetical protein